MSTSPPHVLGFAMAGATKGAEAPPVARHGIFVLTDLRADRERTLIGQVERLWLASEIAKRRSEGRLPKDVVFRRVLVLLPPGRGSEVLLNEEVIIECGAIPRYPDAVSKERGAFLSADDFEDICDARLPQVAEDAGFLLLTYEGGTYYLVFDFFPCYPTVPGPISPADARTQVLRELAGITAEGLFGACFKQPEDLCKRMLEDGWWPALCLLPQTYLQMAAAYERDEPEQATQIVVAYLSPERIRTMAAHWWSLPEFMEQKDIIEQGLGCYSNGWYAAAVRTLVPCIEGTVARRALVAEGAAPTNRDLPDKVRSLAADVVSRYLPERAMQEFVTYLQEHILKHFTWTDSDVGGAEGRHADTHGARVRYDQADALQIIVALDSLYRALRPAASANVLKEPAEPGP